VWRWRPLGREQVQILKEVCFSIGPGEFVAQSGPSGSDKGTLVGDTAGLSIAIIRSSALWAAAVSALVAWSPTRVRDLEVLPLLVTCSP